VSMPSLYNPDRSFSDLALSLEGRSVRVDGFMAPPLKADTNFFVLTEIPMAVCPLCETSAQWPEDILAIYARRKLRVVPYSWPIYATGRLELGDYMDTDFGFLSRVRLIDAKYGRA
ncbi:MAG: hypothetical protein AAF281_16385, partial [Pseudomonadota bacterium]